MKHIASMLLGAFLLGGCSLHETDQLEISLKPTLKAEYRYFNREGINTTAQEVSGLDIFLFNPEGRFLRSIQCDRSQIADPAGVTLLEGVPEGEYTVVSFANVRRTSFADLVQGESTLEALEAHLNDTAGRTSDSLFHSVNRYRVRRGTPPVHAIDLKKIYYRADLTVTGAQRLNPASGAFRVRFTGLPAGVDYRGIPLQEETTVEPLLTRQGENVLIGTCNLPRFEEGRPVRLELQAGAETIGTVALADYLLEQGVGIDFRNERDVVIPIEIDVTTAAITITVNGWDEGAVQFPNVGI